MASPSEQLQYQETTLRALVAGVKPDQWDNATPCTKWTVRDLVNHVVGGGQMLAMSFRGDVGAVDPDAPMPDLLGDDPLAALDGALAAVNEAADAPGAMEKDVVLPFATLPAPIALNIGKFDLLVHCWDIAQATGQPFDPPADIVDEALQLAGMLISPEARNGDTFANEVTVRADATPVQKLVAFTGRTV